MRAEAIGSLAVQALLRELDVWPKPGLVSRIDSGSHSDMDAAMLERSSLALESYFVQLAEAGARNAGMTTLRRLGLAAESAMLAATGGVNTHRGAIFGLGLLCAAAGADNSTPPDEDARRSDRLGSIVRERWGASMNAPPLQDESHGALVQRRYGVVGARAEAASGFSAIYQIGWPALRRGRLLAPGDDNAGGVQCCLALIAAVTDTNLLYRGGVDGLRFCQEIARAFIRRGGVGCADWYTHAINAHRAFVARHLSPGGCADLLAMTLFVDAFQAASMRQAQRCTQEPALV